jgi:hypothetical protein
MLYCLDFLKRPKVIRNKEIEETISEAEKEFSAQTDSFFLGTRLLEKANSADALTQSICSFAELLRNSTDRNSTTHLDVTKGCIKQIQTHLRRLHSIDKEAATKLITDLTVEFGDLFYHMD